MDTDSNFKQRRLQIPLRIPAAGSARVLRQSFAREGVGNAGSPPHPQPRVRSKTKHTSQSPQVHRNHPAFPHAMVLTAYFVLSPEIGLVCHRRLRIWLSAQISFLAEAPVKTRTAVVNSITSQIPLSFGNPGVFHGWIGGDVSWLKVNNSYAGFPDDPGTPVATTAGFDYAITRDWLAGVAFSGGPHT